MPSQQILERAAVADRRVTELLVLWQHHDTREFVPIGRFSNDGSTYTFRYTRAAAGVSDLRPLPGFDDLYQRYESDRMPAILAQRVMRRERPDYANYVTSLGLDPELATPWEQIVESGGHREGDTLQFMELPSIRAGVASARFFVNGVRHIVSDATVSIRGRTTVVTPDGHELALAGLAAGSRLVAAPEDDNISDPDAMIVVTVDGVPLGWVPRALAPSIRELAADGDVPLTVVRTGRPDGPAHQRLVVDMSVAVDESFQFDRDGRWEPLSN